MAACCRCAEASKLCRINTPCSRRRAPKMASLAPDAAQQPLLQPSPFTDGLAQAPGGLLGRAWNNGNVVISVAALVCSTIALFIKQLHGAVPSVQITLISSLISWVLTTGWLLSAGHSLRDLVRAKVPLLLLRGLLGAATSILYYQAIQLLPMNEAVTVFFTNPAMAVLLDWLVNGKLINIACAAGIVSTIAGVVLIGCPTCQFSQLGHLSGRHLAGLGLGLGGAAANAGGYVVVHKIGCDVPFVVLMWWYHTLVTLASVAVMLSAMPLSSVVMLDARQWGWVGAVAAAHFTGQLLLNRGFGLDDASHGAALFAQQVLYSWIWSVTIMHTPIQLCAVLGSAAILVGVVCVTESSGMSHAHMQLEAARTLSTLNLRNELGRTSVLEKLARTGSVPAWVGQLGRTSMPRRRGSGAPRSQASAALLRSSLPVAL